MTVTLHDPEALSFLGNEFLTWLWFRCENCGGVFELPDGEVSLIFNDYVQLASDRGEGEQSIMKKGSAHRSPEARTALRAGKLVTSARIELARGDRAFMVTIKGETLDLGGVKLPKSDEQDPIDKDADRLASLEELSEIVEALFQSFLVVRATAEWDASEYHKMESWVRTPR